MLFDALHFLGFIYGVYFPTLLCDYLLRYKYYDNSSKMQLSLPIEFVLVDDGFNINEFVLWPMYFDQNMVY